MQTQSQESRTDIDITLANSHDSQAKVIEKKNDATKRKSSNYKEMSYEELETIKNKLIASGNSMAAVKYIEQMTKLCDDVYIIGELVLEVADIYFKNNLFKKAALAYSEFVTLYPGNEKIEFALYRSIISSWHCCLSYDRDQTKTEETISLATTYLSNENFSEYKDEILTIRDQCYVRMASSELYICEFYLRRNNLKAVKKRLTLVRDKWLPIVPSITLQLLNLEIKIAELQDNVEELNHKRTEYEKYALASDISEINRSLRMIDRF